MNDSQAGQFVAPAVAATLIPRVTAQIVAAFCSDAAFVALRATSSEWNEVADESLETWPGRFCTPDNVTDACGKTVGVWKPLLVAIAAGHLDAARWLTAAAVLGADSEANRATMYGYALVRACQDEDLDVAKWVATESSGLALGSYGPAYGFFIGKYTVEAALSSACNEGHWAVAWWLVAEYHLEGQPIVEALSSATQRAENARNCHFYTDTIETEQVRDAIIEWLSTSFHMPSGAPVAGVGSNPEWRNAAVYAQLARLPRTDPDRSGDAWVYGSVHAYPRKRGPHGYAWTFGTTVLLTPEPVRYYEEDDEWSYYNEWSYYSEGDSGDSGDSGDEGDGALNENDRAALA